jgi:hypothetical protein
MKFARLRPPLLAFAALAAFVAGRPAAAADLKRAQEIVEGK